MGSIAFPSASAPARRLDWPPWCSTALGLAFAAVFLVVAGRIFPPNFAFVAEEHGQNLLLAGRLAEGQALFRDVFSQYGPLPIYLHAGAAAIFGNTAATFQWFAAAGDAAAFALAARLLLRWLRPAVAAVWLALGIGGWLLREYGPNAYPPFEAIFFLGAMLCWRPPGQRSPARSVTMGFLLGMMQTAKFGGVFIAGLCVVVADAWQWAAEASRPSWRAWLGPLAWTGAGVFLVEGMLAVWLFAGLPAADAADVLWPSYLRESYASIVSPEMRFLHWRGLGFFARVQAPSLAAAAAVLAFALAWRRLSPARAPAADPVRAPWARDYAGLAIGIGAFFPVALAIYLPHLWVTLHYLWIPVLAAAGGFAFFPPWARWLVVLALAAGVWDTTLRPILSGGRPRPGSEEMTFPNGQKLRVTPAEAAAFKAVLERSSRFLPRGTGAPATWLIFPSTFGWEHYAGGRFRVGAAGLRHWWFLPAFVRPREEPTLVQVLGGVDAVLLDLRARPVPAVGPDPASWGWASPRFSAETSAAVAARLGAPEELAPNLWCFPVRR